MRAIRIVVLSLVMVGLTASWASAQIRVPRTVPVPPSSRPVTPRTPETRSDHFGFWSNLSTIDRGTHVDVVLAGGAFIRAEFELVNDTELTLKTDLGRQSFKRDEVDRVYRYAPRIKERAITGAALGAGTGFIISLFANGDPNAGKLRLGLVGSGAIFGTLGGAIQGSLERKRELMYMR